MNMSVVCEAHTYGEIPHGNMKGMTTRMVETIDGDLEFIRQQLMMLRLNGTLVGYQIFDFETVSEFNHADWKAKGDAVIDEWWDKKAITQTVKVNNTKHPMARKK